MKQRLILLFLIVASLGFTLNQEKLPEGFNYIKDVIPTVKVELRYYGAHNFMGVPVDGYNSEAAILSSDAVAALKKVQKELLKSNLSVKIFDAYRPQQAVNHFVRWAKVFNDTIKKKEFYPKVKKQDLFKEGYISSKSGHSRGSTIDMTLVDVITGKELDMGSPWDFFGPESWVANLNLNVQQRANRMLLQNIMSKHGFKYYTKEWWHFTLKNEPFPDTYFDFPIN